MNRKEIHQQIFKFASIALAVCIPFSDRCCTFILILIAANWIIEGDIIHKIKTAYSQAFVVLCSLFYLLELAGLLYTHHLSTGFYHAQTEASSLVIPLLFFSYEKMNEKLVGNIFSFFCLAVFLSSLYCVAIGLIHYQQSGDISTLFFKDLVSPVHRHPVYFSVYTFICIVYLFSGMNESASGRKVFISMAGLIYFSLLLFLLRSKMVVAVTLIYAVYQLISTLVYRKGLLRLLILYPLLLVSLVLLALNTANPLNKQVKLLYATDWSKLHESVFDPNDRFDDISIRITLGRFGIDVLNQSHAWILGVSSGDAQQDINRKIIASGMFTGYPGTEDHGFINYNLHNQYLQTLLNSGIMGLVLLTAILGVAFMEVFKSKSILLFFTLFVFAAFFVTESVLERQMGIVPFFFFISILILEERTVFKKHVIKSKKYDEAVENIC